MREGSGGGGGGERLLVGKAFTLPNTLELIVKKHKCTHPHSTRTERERERERERESYFKVILFTYRTTWILRNGKRKLAMLISPRYFLVQY